MGNSELQETHGRALKLELRNVSKTYGPVVALQPTSLKVSAGEFVTLLGPSGSGKTTLLTLIVGLVASDRGEIWIDGQNVTEQPIHRRDIGMVFQNYALFPHLSVFENVAFPLRMRRVPEAEIKKKVSRTLEIVQLPHVADRTPRELSGGQQQRIALARCAVYEPSIILMDEPFGALDKKLRDEMQVEIKRLHRELGATILFVTHDQEEAMAMSDRICLMNNGGIEQLGTPADIYFNPKSVFSADFLGGSNLFAAKVTAVGSVVNLQTEYGPAVAPPGANIAVGDQVDIMVRPENIRLLEDGEAEDNMVTAVFDGSMMTGSVTRSWGHVADGKQISALALTSELSSSLTFGADVRFGWRKEGTVIIPRSGRSGAR
jgi:putative spermidine/putrescine transport system ATP-binding protein